MRKVLSTVAPFAAAGGFRVERTPAMWQLWFPSDMLEYVNRYATPGSPTSVLAAMDKAAETSWMMNMGTEKGKILEDLIAGRSAISPVTHVLELGTFCGYCTIRLARSLPASATIVTVEKDEKTFDVARQIIGRAGLLEDPEFASYAQNAKASGLAEHAKINMYLGSSGDLLPELRRRYSAGFDFVLMDHWKELYDKDLQSLEKLRLVRKDSAVLADNIKIPGAPRYLEYLYHGKGYQTWRTSVIDVPFEYRPETPDAMTLSIWRGDSEQSPPPPPPREPCASELSAMRSPTDRFICEAELNSPNDGSAVGA